MAETPDLTWVMALTLTLLACGTDRVAHPGNDGGLARPDAGTPFTVEGALHERNGEPATYDGKVLVVWVVARPEPRHYWKAGEGTSRAGRFTVRLDAPPPAEAVNEGGTAVGWLFLVENELSFADGPITRLDLERASHGASSTDAIVHRGASSTWPTWTPAFGSGYSCGRGAGRGYAPTDCGALSLELGDLGTLTFVDWDH